MTIQCVISYFENGDRGYLLGSDSRISTKVGDCIKDEGIAEKAFFGENFIGLFRGSIHGKKNEAVEACYLNYMSSLDGVFCNIAADKDYSEVPLLEKALFYGLFVAKKESDKLQLFGISSFGEDAHKAHKLHELTDQIELSKVWFSGFTTNTFTFEPKAIFNLEEASEVASTLLSANVHFCKDRNYDPGPTHLYVVSSKNVGRIGVV
ncbi:hypothetical protein HZA97_04170 [Candidatus Woesearchaeota archaeon]|nr:hypothetical protein [Candidatus Woesearchaeota archaeon]